jgi:pimeloyl-ACP methyl ester carboxylesterase
MPQAKANGIMLEYDVHGAADAAPLLLIMGLGAQMTRWPAPLVDKLVAKGFRVIRFDNRDVGLSEKIDAAGLPDMAAVLAALQSGAKPPVAYTLADMAADAVGLLDALGIAKAHIVGASMGGMIAQLVAADYPDRVLSLTSIMSSTGNPTLPRATAEAMAVLTQRGPDPNVDLEGFVAHSLTSARVIGSPGYPFDEALLRERTLSDFHRAFYPAGFQRQYAGVMASPDRRPKLKTITAPTMVLHGADDPLVPLAGGRDTADNIPGAELRVVPGMGHDVPPGLYDTIVEAIVAAASRARLAA